MSISIPSSAQHPAPLAFDAESANQPLDLKTHDQPNHHDTQPEAPKSVDLRQLLGNPTHSDPACLNQSSDNKLQHLFKPQAESTQQSFPGGLPPHCFSMSTDGEKLLKSAEELRLQPYDDSAPNKALSQWTPKATIGYGHLISKNEWGTYKNGISQNEAEALFKQDIKPFIDTVQASVHVNLQQNQFDALVMLAYNIGTAGFKSSSLVKMINNPGTRTSYPTVEAAWKAWNKDDGQVITGLVNRRNAEWNVFNKAVYEKW